MSVIANAAGSNQNLVWLIRELDAHSGVLDELTVRGLLTKANLDPAEVAPYIEERADAYARRCVIRRENYELLVLTWLPSQGSVAHDHSGSLCGLKVVQGTLTEQLFEEAADGCVRKTISSRVDAGQVIVDPGVVIHALTNDGATNELLVTVHVYSPPLPEVRRYAVSEGPPAKLFVRSARPAAKVIAIIGGGFTGVMTLANLLRLGNKLDEPLHIVLIERQAALGEGAAYRTNDVRHLLNVPANRMSVWPDQPDHFMAFAQSRDPAINPYDFLSRKFYGQYVRETMLQLAEAASKQLSVTLVRDEATRLAPSASSRWSIETAGGRNVHADLTVLAIGHRPPNDPFTKQWIGPRTRLVADPWAALVLSQIGPDEPVLLVGSGLTAIDVVLTLNRQDRSAPLIAISRRGLAPTSHLQRQEPATDLSQFLTCWLETAEPLTIRRVVSTLRRHIPVAQEAGIQWQQVIDGLRLQVPQVWDRLAAAERLRFLTHVRPFWEVHRHRMAPAVAETIERLRREKKLEVTAGTVMSATADAEGVDVTFSCRGSSTRRTVRVSWVINCTGPGVHKYPSTHPLLRPLLETGVLCSDELSLGVLTDAVGRAIPASGRPIPTLLIAGTLRKAKVWESTAVAELREQAQMIAQTALATLRSTHKLGKPIRSQPGESPLAAY